MLICDTGSIPAICIPPGAKHVTREAVDLAQQLQPVLEVIRDKGRGDGKITITMIGGRIRRSFELASRWFFGLSSDGDKSR